jgi:hypothetical protein
VRVEEIYNNGSVVEMARKVDEVSNFAFVKLIEQEPGLYDKRHPDYGRRDKMDLVWEGIAREMKESGTYILYNLN